MVRKNGVFLRSQISVAALPVAAPGGEAVAPPPGEAAPPAPTGKTGNPPGALPGTKAPAVSP